MNMPGRTQPTGGDVPITPARRHRVADDASLGAEEEDADVQRGLAAAVLAATARLHLRLDAIGREQAQALAELQVSLEEVRAQLARLEAAGAASTGDPRAVAVQAPAASHDSGVAGLTTSGDETG